MCIIEHIDWFNTTVHCVRKMAQIHANSTLVHCGRDFLTHTCLLEFIRNTNCSSQIWAETKILQQPQKIHRNFHQILWKFQNWWIMNLIHPSSFEQEIDTRGLERRGATGAWHQVLRSCLTKPAQRWNLFK